MSRDEFDALKLDVHEMRAENRDLRKDYESMVLIVAGGLDRQTGTTKKGLVQSVDALVAELHDAKNSVKDLVSTVQRGANAFARVLVRAFGALLLAALTWLLHYWWPALSRATTGH